MTSKPAPKPTEKRQQDLAVKALLNDLYEKARLDERNADERSTVRERCAVVAALARAEGHMLTARQVRRVLFP